MGSGIWRIVIAAFIGMSGFGAVIPLLPVYLHEGAGASTFLTGLLIGIASGFALLGRLVAGRTADRRGRRPTLLIGMAFCAAAGLLYLPALGLWALTAGRVLHGLGEGFFVTAAVTWVVDIAPANRRAQALGYLSSGIWGGLSVGPAIGQALGGITPVALFLTASSIAAFIMVFAIREIPQRHEHVRSRWLPRPVLLPGIMLGLGNVAYAAMAGFLILLLRSRGHHGAWAFPAFALAVLFGRAAFGGLPDRAGPRRSLLAGYALLVMGLIAIIGGRNSALDLPAALLVGLGYSFPWPALASIVVAEVPASERGAALGALNAFYDLFVAISSALAGAAADKWGLAAPFWIALGSVTSAAAIVLFTSFGAHGRDGPSTVHEGGAQSEEMISGTAAQR